MSDRLAGIALQAAMLSSYVLARSLGQGHDKALARANKSGRLVWCSVLGYNDYSPITV